MKKPAPIKEAIDQELVKMNKARQRGGLLRETALLKFRWVPNIRKIIQYVAEALYRGAGAQPLDPELLGESVKRAKVRAVGEELRHLQDFLEEVAEPAPVGGEEGAASDPADRRLSKWAEEQRREIMRLAVRVERRVGPTPKKATTAIL